MAAMATALVAAPRGLRCSRGTATLPTSSSSSSFPSLPSQSWRRGSMRSCQRATRAQANAMHAEDPVSVVRNDVISKDVPLIFLPFLEYQLEALRPHLSAPLEVPAHLAHASSPRGRALSWAYEGERIRRARFTYLDCGAAAQVFNSVVYPHERFDLPILGVDFISFGKKKIICVMDFQPLSQDPAYLAAYVEPLKDIRDRYTDLAGRMSARFYDETKFFSQQLLLVRSETPDIVTTRLFPAFKEYLALYLSLLHSAEPCASPSATRQAHTEYDCYSAEKDPAVGVFQSYWGKEWAEEFLHDFLFPDSVSKSTMTT
eukprot:jgi/Chlat1/215/Chrsp1S03128